MSESSKAAAMVLRLLTDMEKKKADLNEDASATVVVYQGYAADGSFLVKVREYPADSDSVVDAETFVRETPGVEFVFRSTVYRSVTRHDVELCP